MINTSSHRIRNIAFFALAIGLASAGVTQSALAATPDQTWAAARKAEAAGDYPTMVKLLLPLAEDGDLGAQYMVGLMYETGQSGQRDPSKAAKWYRKAAEQGFARAQYYLGDLYYRGKGDMNDYAEALKWYRRAANQGTAMAAHMLGIMYVKGQGTEIDNVQAYKWFSVASTTLPTSGGTGYQAMAFKARDAVEAKMTPEEIKQGKKLVSEWKQVSENPPGKAAYIE